MRERGLVSSPNEDISVIFTDCFWMLLALPSKMCPRLHARSTAEHHPWSPGKAVNSTAFLSRNIGISGTEVGYVYKNNQRYSSPDYLILVSSCQSLRLISQGQAKFSGNWTSLVISFFFCTQTFRDNFAFSRVFQSLRWLLPKDLEKKQVMPKLKEAGITSRDIECCVCLNWSEASTPTLGECRIRGIMSGIRGRLSVWHVPTYSFIPLKFTPFPYHYHTREQSRLGLPRLTAALDLSVQRDSDQPFSCASIRGGKQSQNQKWKQGKHTTDTQSTSIEIRQISSTGD